MRNSVIAYDNLRAEMSRKNIGVVEMARSLGYNRDTLARKLSKRANISLKEAFAIQRAFFPDMNLRYLFSELYDKADDGLSYPVNEGGQHEYESG